MIIETGIRIALVNAAAKAASKGTRSARSVILRVADSADVGVGKRQVKDWNAHLSMPTYARLKSMGVMA